MVWSVLGFGTLQCLPCWGSSPPASNLSSREACPTPSMLYLAWRVPEPAERWAWSKSESAQRAASLSGPSLPAGPGSGKSGLHTPNPLPSLPTHTFSLGPKHGGEPASLLGNRGTTPNTRDCVSCQHHAPTWACTPGQRLAGGRGRAGRQEGAGPQGSEPPPPQAQAGQGCCFGSLWLHGPQPQPPLLALNLAGLRRRRVRTCA